jgi:TetR/AcrR family transcriptional regulator
MAGLKRKDRIKEQGRQEILEAAMALFSERGFHSVSMHQIAEQAGVAVGTLYNFFTSKEELYNALMEVCVAGVAGVLMPILDDSGAEPLDRICRVIAAHGQLVRENAPYIRLSQSRFSDEALKAGMGAKCQAMMDEMQQKLASVLKEGVDRGVFRALDPALMANLFRAIMEASAHAAIREPSTLSDADIRSTIETLFLHGIVRNTSDE